MEGDLIGYIINSALGNFNWEELYYSFMVFANQNPVDISLQIFFGGGWILFIIIFTKGLYDIWLDGRQGKFAGKWKFNLLAIDIPKNNEQTPKAVENIFAALAGAYSGPNLIDKYWDGKTTESFSFEIVSLEGHIRFLVRVPSHFRDLVEAAVYSQYPEAEITEVTDYTEFDSDDIDSEGKPIPFSKLKFPNKVYKLWGCEFVFVKPYPYPIRTYPEFEHSLSGNFIDPMAGVLEILSRLNPGEQIWIQLVITPQPPGWGEPAKKIVAQLIGKEYKDPAASKFDPTSLVTKPVDSGMGFVGGIMEQLTGISLTGTTEKKKEDEWRMFKITPGERSVLERVENKISKQNFKVKFRMIYLGRKEIFAKGRGVVGVIGAIQQFNTSDANGFKPGKISKTAADYIFVDKRVEKRQNSILRYFCKRSNFYGEKTGDILWMSPEELASVWHFPVISVKAAEVSKIGSKKAPPPTRLPYDQRAAPAAPKEEREVIRTVPVQPIFPGQSVFGQEPVAGNQNVQPNIPSAGFEGARIISGNPRSATESVVVQPPIPNVDSYDQQPPTHKGAPPPNLPFV
ncbi:MAG: hypothetical protein BWY53_00215 [Parcubacteria group bacterium ADurb.Bin326]|nr:MAG: hypothetical protein BWY53_00215 [Parcubacteria group bacterium ADurb.Bin326]